MATTTQSGEAGDLTAVVRCHCGCATFPVSIPGTALPLKSSLCHCTSCRHVTGQLFATFAVLPLGLPTRVLDSGCLTRYDSSSTLQRWFCQRCGASVINIDRGDGVDEWEIATGAFDLPPGRGLAGSLKRVQLWVSDVQSDGGAVGWVNRGLLQGMDRNWKGRGTEMVTDETVDAMLTGSSDRTQGSRLQAGTRAPATLRARCHCGLVRFELGVPPRDGRGRALRFKANLCACTSCRQASGFEVTSWIGVPRKLIHFDNGTPDLDAFLADSSKLTLYHTSTEVDRHHCVRCGATVFYYKHGLETIDVGMGLLDFEPESSSRHFLSWVKEVGSEEDAIDQEFVRNITAGMKRDTHDVEEAISNTGI